ncbi:MAG: endonuclease [Bacteroidales bacterium]|nr:MAG: endonuclease [Bacteroidales bacterium]
MKKTGISIFFLLPVLLSMAQPAGYYNGTGSKTGSDLKSVLNDIIKGHIDFSYSQAKYIINYSDADPNDENNVILFYTQRSQNAETYGTGEDDINREHVWAKSHGNFEGIRPMDGDAFNLRPADASVNLQRSNLDFDNCSSTGTEIDEAPGTYYTVSRFEPADAVKGQVARIIFYMAVRYEGSVDEMDLEVVDEVNTAGTPRHGKLSTLIQWNRNFPPSDFERRRNERIFQSQHNRNPFIDHPEYADLIWDGGIPSGITIDSMSMNPFYPEAGHNATITASISSGQALNSVSLYWGNTHDAETNHVEMVSSGNIYSGEMDLSGFSQGEYLHFKIVATNGTTTGVQRGTHLFPSGITPAQITGIKEIQGTGNSSPLLSQTVTTAGIVTGNFDNTFYIQDSDDPYSGLCIFGSNSRGRIGDSIVVTGDVTEYQNLTELQNISYLYSYSISREPETLDLTISQIGEEYEGMLVKIGNCQFADGGTVIDNSDNTFSFSDGTGNMVLFSRHDSRLAGHEVPSGVVNITGIVSQYGNDYQILVRDMNDFGEVEDTSPPQIMNVQVLDSNCLMVDFNEKLDSVSSQNPSNYTLNHNISVTGVYLYEDTRVCLSIAGMQGGTHILTVNLVEDRSGNAVDNATFEFTYTPVSVPVITDDPVRIFSNPGNDRITVEFYQPGLAAADIQLYNLTGKLVCGKRTFFTEGINRIYLDNLNLPGGIYILKIRTGDREYHKKIVME